MKSFKTSCLVGLAMVAMLSACQHPNVVPVATESDLVSQRIAQAAETASKALDTISSIDQVRTPPPPTPDYQSAPASMTQPITIKWTGPIEQITKTLATRAGLGFRIKGRPPAIPLSVNIDVYQEPLIQVLHDLGLQAGERADLAVDGQLGVVEIRYAPADRL